MDGRAKVELFEQIRSEYEFDWDRSRVWLGKFGVRQALAGARPPR